MSIRSVLTACAVVFALALSFGGSFGSVALADEYENDPAFVAIGAGWYDWNDDQQAGDFRAEYRHDSGLWFIKPWIGVEATTDGAVYGLGGVLADLYLGRNFVITPSFGAGLYHDGDGKDLGSAIEFRSQLELGWSFEDRSRVSFAISHISNAHITERNPGTEIFTVYYLWPLD